MLKVPIEEDVGLKVLGYLPRQKDLGLPERHLGLVPTVESDELKEKRIFKAEKKYDMKLGIAYDEAFNFYYQDNLDLLKELRADLIYFSPVKDKEVPELDGMYIGGGFPESFLSNLERNVSMKDSLLKNIEEGLPIYAECGGLMYLSREIKDFNNNTFSMVGAVPAPTVMTGRLKAMGYVDAVAMKDHLLLKEGESLRGHEFHYSTLLDIENMDYAYSLTGCKGKDGRLEGFIINNLLASQLCLYLIVKRRLQRF